MRKKPMPVVVCVAVLLVLLVTSSPMVATDKPGGGNGKCCECTINGNVACSCSIGPCTCQQSVKPDGTILCTCSCGASKQP